MIKKTIMITSIAVLIVTLATIGMTYQAVEGGLVIDTINGLGVPLTEPCLETEEICKEVFFFDAANPFSEIEVGEFVFFRQTIFINNNSPAPWIEPSIKDRWGAELFVGECSVSAGPIGGPFELFKFLSTTTKGNSDKEFLDFKFRSDINPGQSLVITCFASTDINPGGHQEYTKCGDHEFNSGAVVKFKLPDGSQRSFESNSVIVPVVCDV